MVRCCVPSCTTYQGRGIKLYRMPTDLQRRNQFVEQIQRPNWSPSKNARICEKHFNFDQFEVKFGEMSVPKHQRILKENAVPTIFPHLNRNHITNFNESINIRKNVESVLKDHSYFGQNMPPETVHVSKPNENLVLIDAIDDTPNCEAEIELETTDQKTHEQTLEIERQKLLIQQQIKRIEALEEQNRIHEEEKANRLLPKDLFKKIFGDDQIQFLQKGRVKKWSDETIKKGIKLRFACGTRAYEDLIKDGYPLPSVRTLQKRSEHLKFEPGCFEEIIEMMGEKYKDKPENEKLFALSLDEMALKAGTGMDYDLRSDSYQGDATLPGHNGPASKALVFQIASIGGPRVKQIVGYHFTPSSVESKPVAEIIEDIICKLHHVGISVLVVTADAGSTNKGAFK